MNPKPSHPPDEFPASDEVLKLAPDQEDEETMYRPRRQPKKPAPTVESDANQDTALDSADFELPLNGPPPTSSRPMSEALRWALDALHEPAMAAADWLARDIDPAQPSAAALLTSPAITLAQVRQAKAVYKSMRIVGEKSADRRVGARMYAAAIAAGLVRFGKKVSTQSNPALQRGFQALLDDRRMPLPLRDLAGMALCVLKDNGRLNPDPANDGSGPA